MLAREQRLRKSADIARVYKLGRFGNSGELQVKALLRKQTTTRVAVVVSKKVSKKAVVRNRIRRRLTANLAARWQTLAAGYDIVVSVRSDVSELPSPELSRKLDQCLTRCGVQGTGMASKIRK